MKCSPAASPNIDDIDVAFKKCRSSVTCLGVQASECNGVQKRHQLCLQGSKFEKYTGSSDDCNMGQKMNTQGNCTAINLFSIIIDYLLFCG